MSTLTPHHVGFTTLTFHLASLLYTTLYHAQGFDTTCSAFSQHNEQQPGLQFAAIQPLACACYHLDFLCMAATLYIKYTYLRIFEQPQQPCEATFFMDVTYDNSSKSLASAVMSTTTELGFPHTSIGKCLLAAIATSPAQGHPLVSLSLTTYLCASNHLCLRIKPYSGNCLKLNRKQKKKHQHPTSTPHQHHINTTSTPHQHHINTTSTPHQHHIDTTQQPTKQGNKMKEKEQTKKGRIWIGWKKEKGEGEGKGMENWLLLTMARKRDLSQSPPSTHEILENSNNFLLNSVHSFEEIPYLTRSLHPATQSSAETHQPTAILETTSCRPLTTLLDSSQVSQEYIL
ncbi:hypothetical protein N7536_007620 [Penicillium majusculum]|nr:hypothetical protein N7536_007620 [Penicillium majusculum]